MAAPDEVLIRRALPIIPDRALGLALPAWTPADGPAPYVWAGMDAGARFLGSAKWSTQYGVLHPDELFPLGRMWESQILAELQDDWINADRSYRSRIEDLIQHPERGAADLLRKLRPNYPELILPTSLPRNIMVFRWRRGWKPAGAAGTEI